MNDKNSDIKFQTCFGIDYDFAEHKCFFFGSNYIIAGAGGTVYPLHCLTTGTVYPASQTSRPNPNVIHIQLCEYTNNTIKIYQ